MKTKKALTKQKIITVLRQHQGILKNYKVRRIGLFGSYAIDKQNKKSDIDFLVEFEEPSFDNFMGLIEYLEKLFGKKVEVLTPEGVENIRIKEVAESIKKSVVYV